MRRIQRPDLRGGKRQGVRVGGFTLIELLVAAVVLGLLSIVLTQVLFSSMRMNSKSGTAQDIKASGDRTLDAITRIVQNAKSMRPTFSGDTCGTSPNFNTISRLTVTGADGKDTVIGCSWEPNDIARIASSSVATSQIVYLTGTGVSVYNPENDAYDCEDNAFKLECSSIGDTPFSLRVSFTLRQKDTSAGVAGTASEFFQTTVSIRNRKQD